MSKLANLANQKATPEELRDIAKKIEPVWDEVATFLDAGLFTAGCITVIKKNHLHDGEFIRANTMLQQWSNAKHKGATRGRIIKAMDSVGLRADARAVFEEGHQHHGLVDYVCDQSN
jgi:hypothetical protein